eukprot:6177336-Pleurochrysis_carterae.AAC.3
MTGFSTAIARASQLVYVQKKPAFGGADCVWEPQRGGDGVDELQAAGQPARVNVKDTCVRAGR